MTVVTPSFNQADFLEETIRSVLLQGYPNLEYMIIDGGSTDGSVEIIKKYDAWISHWESRPDRGQAHAINKGFSRAKGDLLLWINSDDLLLKGGLNSVAKAYRGDELEILVGDAEDWYMDDGHKEAISQKDLSLPFLLLPEAPWSWRQQATFVPKILFESNGLLDENMHYAFDLDWMFRLLRQGHIRHVPAPLAAFRLYGGSKTGAQFGGMLIEVMNVKRQNLYSAHGGRKLKYLGAYHYHIASVYLTKYTDFFPYANRWKGLGHLGIAFLCAPSMVARGDFLALCYRGLFRRLVPLGHDSSADGVT